MRFVAVTCAWIAVSLSCRSPEAVKPATTTAKPAVAERADVRATVKLATDALARNQGKVEVGLDASAPLESKAVTPVDLSAADAAALFTGLPALPTDPGPAPITRASSVAPPKPGSAPLPIAFVRPGGKTIADAAPGKPVLKPPPLAVSFIPRGDIVMSAEELTVRFEQTMVPVAQVDKDVAAIATITPPVAGTWRWIDTRVARFAPTTGRFTPATEYTVAVAAGARALNGSVLPATASETFRTPTVELEGRYPSGDVRPDAPIAVGFNQAVDPAQVAKLLRVERDKKRIPIRIVTLDEAKILWARDPSFVFDAKQLPEHAVVIAPTGAWPADTQPDVMLGAGAISKLGPRVSIHESYVSFSVVPRFEVRGVSCAPQWEPRPSGLTCTSGELIDVHFSNDVRAKGYRASQVQIAGRPSTDPEDNKLHGQYVSVRAPKAIGRFEIAIADDLVDEHGQKVAPARRPSFATKPDEIEAALTADTGLHVLDPRFEIPQWIVQAEAIGSFRVELYAVRPEDYFEFVRYEAGKRATPPGRRVYDKTHAVGKDYTATARVDLRPALAKTGVGHVIAVATGAPKDVGTRTAWIQVTKLGVTARLDGERTHAWVHQLGAGKALAPQVGAEVTLLADGRTSLTPVATDTVGHAGFELLPPRTGKAGNRNGSVLLVRSGEDSVFAAIDGRHERAIRSRSALWYVTDDRFTYMPGEPVYVKGWVRWTHSGTNPEPALPTAGGKVRYQLVDRRGNEIATGEASLTAQGGFDFVINVPSNANLGSADLHLQHEQQEHHHRITLAEFRTPTFSVEVEADAGSGRGKPLHVGESIEYVTRARYYGGGGLPGATVKWRAKLSSASFRPPNWDGFAFDAVRPLDSRRYRYWSVRERTAGGITGTLDAESKSRGVIAIPALPDGRPALLDVEVTVTDVDRARIVASTSPVLVHPSAYYVGLRRGPKGDDLEAIVVDIDGTPVAGVAIDVAVEGILGEAPDDEGNEPTIVDAQRCKLTSATAPVSCGWKPRDPTLAYVAIARIVDARGRANASAYDVPWSKPQGASTPDLQIVPDKASYRVGDTARIDVTSKVFPATAIVSVVRNGVVEQHRIEITSASTVVDVPIAPSYVENLHLIVDRWSKTEAADPKNSSLPEHRWVTKNITVDLESARLDVAARPAKPVVAPGERASFEVHVMRGGKPVAGAEVALFAVDEAILAVSTRTHADPLPAFYDVVGDNTEPVTTLDLVKDAQAYLDQQPGFEREKLGTFGHHRGMRGRTSAVPSVRIGSPNAAGGAPKFRKDFRATALWSPRLVTDASGRATATVDMPDGLTRYRIVALATSDTRYFGKAESTIVTRRELNARAVAPRFLTQGDRFTLPVVVQNLGATRRTVDVGVRAANLVATGPTAKRITLEGGQRAEVRFDYATTGRGRAVLQTVAAARGARDAAQVDVQVYEPATTESFATYGVVADKPGFERLVVPADVFPEVGGVEVELASTQMSGLLDAFDYLQRYPFECSEQRSSRMLATTAMADVLDAFATPGRPGKAALTAIAADDARLLAKHQNDDGGWGFFEGQRSDPYVTIQVLAALAPHKSQAEAASKAAAYVRDLAVSQLDRLEALARPAPPRAAPRPAPQRMPRVQAPYAVGLVAAAIAGLAAADTLDTKQQGRLASRLHGVATALRAYPLDAKARLLALVGKQPAHAAIRTALLGDVLAQVRETAASAAVVPVFADVERALLVSSTKSTALVLAALLRESPDHALVPKLARGLLDARRRGRWTSTQENLAVLQAMRRYFDVYEKDTPDFAGRLWFGDAAYAEQTFAGRNGAIRATRIPWTIATPSSTHDVALERGSRPGSSATGRLYYRIGVTYAPRRVDVDPLDAGFIVRRTYEALEDPDDVVRRPDGTWKIKLGARVLVRLQATASAPRFGVALVDPLPAGLEPVNAALATSEAEAPSTQSYAWDHRNVRSNRVEVFASELPAGDHHFSYTARAITPGTFVAAPAKAEEMYAPETFGRTGGTTVVVD